MAQVVAVAHRGAAHSPGILEVQGRGLHDQRRFHRFRKLCLR